MFTIALFFEDIERIEIKNTSTGCSKGILNYW